MLNTFKETLHCEETCNHVYFLALSIYFYLAGNVILRKTIWWCPVTITLTPVTVCHSEVEHFSPRQNKPAIFATYDTEPREDRLCFCDNLPMEMKLTE